MAVHVGRNPGVDRQFRHGIAGQQVQNGTEFLRRFDAHTGFDGDFDGALCKNRIQKYFQFRQTAQKSRALTLGRHGAGGTAQIQIDLLVAVVGQNAGSKEKIHRRFGQNLGYHRRIAVVLRQNVPPDPWGDGMLLSGRPERHPIAVHTPEHLIVQIAVRRVGDALHGGKVKAFHQ